MAYRYELHCHTAEGSRCSEMPAEQMAEFYSGLGYDGLFVTDHFSGNGPLPDDTPWRERVDYYYSIYEKARVYGEKLGIKIFFGLEYSNAAGIMNFSRVAGNDFLLLNVARRWLLDNRDAFEQRPAELFARVRRGGGFIVQAHPFLEAAWVESIRLYPRAVDAAETYNAKVSELANASARHYAASYGLLATAGSDCHSIYQTVLCGLETDAPCHTAGDLVNAIREKKTRAFTIVR